MPKSPPADAKLRSLHAQGAVNPRPQAVTDGLFAASEFFDPRDLVQVKYEMLRRVEDGQSVTEAAATFGFSRPSFYQAQAALAQRDHPFVHRLAAEFERGRADQNELAEFLRHFHDFVQTDAALVSRVVTLVAALPLVGDHCLCIFGIEAGLHQRGGRRRVRFRAVLADSANQTLCTNEIQ